MNRPLDGVLVADLSRVLAGPTAAMTLADLGARVIKVERPGEGDDTRAFGPPWAGSSSSYFESANRSKESLALDFADPVDAALARELVDRADIVIENFRAGSLARYGLDAASMRERNPRLIVCSISGFGSGAGAELPGYDFLVQAVGGLMSITGDPGGEPRKVGVAVVDLLCAKDAVVGILAAVRHRDLTGEGQHVEVNLLSSTLASLANQASAYLSTGHSPGPMGNQHPSIAPYETLRCADGLVAVAVGNARQFRALAELIGDTELAHDERFATNGARVGHREDLIARLEAGLARAGVDDWVQRMLAVGIPAGRVNDVGEAIALARRLGLEPTVADGDAQPEQVRHPVAYSAFEVVPPTAPPALDEHGEALRAWLSAPR
jgi:formyl-CoA transferase